MTHGMRRHMVESAYQTLVHVSKQATDAEMYARVLSDLPDYMTRTFMFHGRIKMRHMGLDEPRSAWRFDDHVAAANDDLSGAHVNGSHNGFDSTVPADSGEHRSVMAEPTLH